MIDQRRSDHQGFYKTAVVNSQTVSSLFTPSFVQDFLYIFCSMLQLLRMSQHICDISEHIL